MNSRELGICQDKTRQSMLSSLFSMCQRRFVRSAELVGMSSEAVARLGWLRVTEPVDLSTLSDPWTVLCARYVAQRYDAQNSLFSGSVQAEDWSRFVYDKLFSHLVRDDEVVRNVLRAIGGLPSKSSYDAVAALRIYFGEMTLPDRKALWAPDEETEFWL